MVIGHVDSHPKICRADNQRQEPFAHNSFMLRIRDPIQPPALFRIINIHYGGITNSEKKGI